jgi:hypothetical protein
MTSVLGHLTGLEFEPQYKGWKSCSPGQLFDAPVLDIIEEVSINEQAIDALTDHQAGQEMPREEYTTTGPLVEDSVHLDGLRSRR